MRGIAKKENNGPTPAFKDDKALLSAYFVEILPDYDQERVYASDIKKVINWYNILQSKGLVSSEAPAEAEAKTEKAAAAPAEAKPAKAPKTVAPKAAGAASAKKAPAPKATKSTKK